MIKKIINSLVLMSLTSIALADGPTFNPEGAIVTDATASYFANAQNLFNISKNNFCKIKKEDTADFRTHYKENPAVLAAVETLISVNLITENNLLCEK